MHRTLEELASRCPALVCCGETVNAAVDMLLSAYRAGGKVLVCGNGGSAADAEHICGELLKKFKKHRDIPADVAAKLPSELAAKLEGSLPAISLVSMSGILTAVANDVAWETAFGSHRHSQRCTVDNHALCAKCDRCAWFCRAGRGLRRDIQSAKGSP